MKLADRTVETHSSGIRSASGFSIAQTSKMFKILSDSLYSDKVMAVIRELSTNAYDSHVSAGNKNPFKVILPSAANPNFTVRDYGTGLSKEDMESLYTTYGASNKNDSNDFVGCLGLGSKSPFAYTKSFTTSSYFNGKKYTYIAAIDDDGVPTLNLFGTTNTDEPNGLEISFAVKQHDFHEFSHKAVRIFHYFKTKPIIEGGVNWNFNEEYSSRNIVLSGTGWRVCRFNNNLFPNLHHRVNSGVVAIMGNIAYPVQESNIIGEEKQATNDAIQKWNRAFGKADIDSWKSFVGEIINQNLYLELDFGIGELEMDVSREGLQYTKQVIKTIREKTQEIYLELKEEFSKKISAAKTKIEAISLYYSLNDLAGNWGVGASWTDANGKKHNINSGQDLEYKIPTGKSLYVFNYRTAGYRSRRMVYLTDRIHHNTLTGKGEYYWNSNSRKTGPIKFFVCDVKTEETAKKIVTRYCNEKDCFAYLMVDTNDYTKSDEGFDDLIDDIGSHNVLKVSDYKDLIKNNNPRKASTRDSKGSVSDQDVFFIYGASKDSGAISNQYNDAGYLKTLTKDELEEFVDSDEIVYIPITRYKSNDGEGLPAISDISYMINEASMKNLIKDMFGNTKIYAIKSSVAKKMIDDDYNMISFNDFFKNKLKQIKKRFDDVGSYNSLVEYCRKQFSDNDNNDGYRYYNHGTMLHQFSFHVLNIFGLDYQKFIKNETLVNSVNYYMITEFFSDTIHRHKYDIPKFKQEDYFGHINSILTGMGIDNVDSQSIRTANVEYNALISMIKDRVYRFNSEDYLSIIKTQPKSDHKLPKASDIRKNLKVAIDSNPMVKYIMGTHQVSGSIRELSNKNPISALDGRGGYYSNNGKDWFVQMDQDSVELFKIQLSSLIK